MKKFLTLRRASGVISPENSQGSFPKRGTANSIARAIGKRWRWKCKAEQRRLRDGLALVEFVSRAGDAVGDVLGARVWLYHFRCPPGFCQQGTDQPSVWPDEFEIGLAGDRAGCGEQLLFVCGGCGGAERDPARRGPHPSSRVYVRLDQFGDCARGGPLRFAGVRVWLR